MKKVYSILCISFLFSCNKTKKIHESPLFNIGKPLAEINDGRLKEISGLAESINNPGYLWAENDGGNDAKIFLINKKAHIKLTCILKNIVDRDWEDIAVGPGPEEGKNYIYLAEIGDNNAVYPLKCIYRFEEPVLGNEKKIQITKIDTITFKFSDEEKDSETLLLDPLTKDLFIISKREEPVHVYELKYPYSTKDTITAPSILTLPLTQLTAGSVSSDGKEILIKNYDDIFYYKREEGKSIPESLKQAPIVLPYEPEPQGEAIAWARNGSGFFTASEAVIGETSHLFFFKRK